MAGLNVPPKQELMSSNGFDLLPGEQEVHAASVQSLDGSDVKIVVTDRRLITRSQDGACSFPLNMLCVCCKAEVENSYAIADLRYIRPYTFKGWLGSLIECCSPMHKVPGCCCIPPMRSGCIQVNFARPRGEIVPGWGFWPLFSTSGGWSVQYVSLMMERDEALKLKSVLTQHPEAASGLNYTLKHK